MTDFNQLLQQGNSSAWFFIPTAIVLGALHGLEPGHSKTMMAAFIIAVRGTVKQAILLGLCAAFSHSLVIWLLAAVALKFGSQWNAESTEPYFQLGSAAIIASLAFWMLWRTLRDVRAEAAHEHDHAHDETKSSIPATGQSSYRPLKLACPLSFGCFFFNTVKRLRRQRQTRLRSKPFVPRVHGSPSRLLWKRTESIWNRPPTSQNRTRSRPY